jgi:hypothetical protein
MGFVCVVVVVVVVWCVYEIYCSARVVQRTSSTTTILY